MKVLDSHKDGEGTTVRDGAALRRRGFPRVAKHTTEDCQQRQRRDEHNDSKEARGDPKPACRGLGAWVQLNRLATTALVHHAWNSELQVQT